jgi:hypothetical protein
LSAYPGTFNPTAIARACFPANPQLLAYPMRALAGKPISTMSARSRIFRRKGILGGDKNLQRIFPMKLVETSAEIFLRALKEGTVSTNVCLRRMHNFALDMNWLLAPIIPERQWPTVRHKPDHVPPKVLTLRHRIQEALRRAWHPWRTGDSRSWFRISNARRGLCRGQLIVVQIHYIK